jgi:hypothetical protein
MISRQEFEGIRECEQTLREQTVSPSFWRWWVGSMNIPEDWIPRIGLAQPLEIEMDGARLHLQLINGEIALLKGVLPQNINGSHA